jgi:hypothetical protein
MTYIDDLHDSRTDNHFLDPGRLNHEAVLFTQYLGSVLARRGMFGGEETIRSLGGASRRPLASRGGCWASDGVRTPPIATGIVCSLRYRGPAPTKG